MLALLSDTNGSGMKRHVADAWMDRWLELDAPGALQFLSGTLLPKGEILAGKSAETFERLTSTPFGSVFRALVRREPEWTRELLVKLPRGRQRHYFIADLLEEVTKSDAGAAAAYLEAFESGAGRRPAFTGYILGLTSVDLRSAFDEASKEPPGRVREDMLSLVFTSVGERKLGLMYELLGRLDDPAARRESMAVALQGARVEVAVPLIIQEAEKLASSGEWDSKSNPWLELVGSASQTSHARALADWAVNFAPDQDRRMFAQIARNWARKDPAEFQAWLTADTTSLGGAAVAKLAEPLASVAAWDVAAARDWAEALPAGPLRDQARFQVVVRGSEGDLEYAAAAYQPLATTDTDGTLAGQLAGILALQDCAVAGDWALQQPLLPARVAALREVGAAWTGRDPVAARDWLGKLPPGSERDAAVTSYASIVARADPEGAAKWAELVTAPAERTKVVVDVYSVWSRENPAAARAWFRSLEGLDEDAVPVFQRQLR